MTCVESVTNNINDLLNTLELSYTNNHLLDTIEKKYNKLINTEIIPYVSIVLCQYYLVILGGDYQSAGLVNDLKVYICKLKSNLLNIEKTDISSFEEKNKLRAEKLKKILIDNEIRCNILYKKMIETYQKYLEMSIKDESCYKFNLNTLHKLQLITNYNCKNNIESQEHIENLNNELDKLNEFLNDNQEEDIIVKFIDSQISVIEQQFDFLKV